LRHDVDSLEVQDVGTASLPRENVSSDPAPMSAGTRARLERAFTEPNEQLQHLLGEDLGWG